MKLNNEKLSNNNNDIDKGVLLEAKPKTKKPSMYNVLLLNDDYTPMEFVVLVLESIFNKKQEEATQIMLHVLKNGKIIESGGPELALELEKKGYENFN